MQFVSIRIVVSWKFDREQWIGIVATSPELQTGGTRGIRAGGYSGTDRIEFFNMDSQGMQLILVT